MAADRPVQIHQNDLDVLNGLYTLIDAYRIYAAQKGSGYFSEARAQKADRVKAKWDKIVANTKKGIERHSIQLPINYALLELKRLLHDADLQKGKFNRHSLKSYFLAYYKYLEAKANEEFQNFQKDARTLAEDHGSVSYGERLTQLQLTNVHAYFKQDVEKLRPNEIEAQFHAAAKKRISTGKYKPIQVSEISLHAMHRDLNYEESYTSTNEAFLQGVAKPAGHKFIRTDGKVVKYFYPIRDADVGTDVVGDQPMLNIDDWFNEFGKNIKDDELAIVPLQQVQHGRAHFNTLVIHNKKIYIIEPRSTNVALEGIKPIRYPSEATGEKLKQMFGAQYEFKNLFTEQQPLFNDEDCGAHQINYTELLYGLPDVALESGDKLAEIMQQAQLSRRLNDEDILARMEFMRRQYNAINPPPAEQRSEEEEKAEGDDEFVLARRRDSDFDIEDEKVAQRVVHMQIEISQGNTYEKNIEAAKKHMFSYIAYAKTHNGFFHPHTREKTADFLALCADGFIAVTSEDRVGREKSREHQLRLAMLYFAAYSTITDKNSRLRKHLGKALAGLLDCSAEYHTLKNNVLSTPGSFENLFETRLHAEVLLLKGMATPAYVAEFKKMKEAMKEIDEVDSSIMNRFIRTADQDKKHSTAKTKAMNALSKLATIGREDELYRPPSPRR
jgi:hypothetical protein